MLTLVLALVVGWCLVSAGVALGLGPALHRAAVLAERHDGRVLPRSERRAA